MGGIHLKYGLQRQGCDRKMPLIFSPQDPSLHSGTLELLLLLTVVSKKVGREAAHEMLWMVP